MMFSPEVVHRAVVLLEVTALAVVLVGSALLFLSLFVLPLPL